MTSSDAPHNPFATQFVRPGCIPYLFPTTDQSTATLLARLRTTAWRGEIRGPHGTGKSTLLHSLREPLLAEGKQLVWYRLSQGDRRLPQPDSALSSWQGDWNSSTLQIIDGAEQLSWWQRWWILRRSKRNGFGILWTTHQPLGLPLLWETFTDLASAKKIVGHLVAENDPRLSSSEVATAFEQFPTNMREMLFRLFDIYQRRL